MKQKKQTKSNKRQTEKAKSKAQSKSNEVNLRCCWYAMRLYSGFAARQCRQSYRVN